jgi:hypothetical protein
MARQEAWLSLDALAPTALHSAACGDLFLRMRTSYCEFVAFQISRSHEISAACITAKFQF